MLQTGNMADPKEVQLKENVLRIFLFVNPSSGGNHGAKYMACPPELELTLDKPTKKGVKKATLMFFNIKEGKPGDKPGFHRLKKYLNDEVASNESVPVVVCGGDGNNL